MKFNRKTRAINLSEEALTNISCQIQRSTLKEEDKKIVLAILATYQWIYRQLASTRLSVKKLKNLFGFKTEKLSSLLKNKNFSEEENLTVQNGAMNTAEGSEVNTPRKKS